MCLNFPFPYCAQEQKKLRKMVARKRANYPSAHAKGWGGSRGSPNSTLSVLWHERAQPDCSPSSVLGPTGQSQLLLSQGSSANTGLRLWLWFEASQLLIAKAVARAVVMAEMQFRVFSICKTSSSLATGEGDHPVTYFKSPSFHFIHYWQK